MSKKRSRRSRTRAVVHDNDAAFEYGLIHDRVGAEIDRRATRLQAHLEMVEREQEALEHQQLADNYCARRLSEETAAKTIAPQLVSYVTGASVDEVEVSIQDAKRRTAEIAEQVRKAQTRSFDGRFIAPQQNEQQVVEDVQNISLRDGLRTDLSTSALTKECGPSELLGRCCEQGCRTSAVNEAADDPARAC